MALGRLAFSLSMRFTVGAILVFLDLLVVTLGLALRGSLPRRTAPRGNVHSTKLCDIVEQFPPRSVRCVCCI